MKKFIIWSEMDQNDYWLCPICEVANIGSSWEYCEVYCEDCGDHEARECPNCEKRFDNVWGLDDVADATYQDLNELNKQ